MSMWNRPDLAVGALRRERDTAVERAERAERDRDEARVACGKALMDCARVEQQASEWSKRAEKAEHECDKWRERASNAEDECGMWQTRAEDAECGTGPLVQQATVSRAAVEDMLVDATADGWTLRSLTDAVWGLFYPVDRESEVEQAARDLRDAAYPGENMLEGAMHTCRALARAGVRVRDGQ